MNLKLTDEQIRRICINRLEEVKNIKETKQKTMTYLSIFRDGDLFPLLLQKVREYTFQYGKVTMSAFDAGIRSVVTDERNEKDYKKIRKQPKDNRSDY